MLCVRYFSFFLSNARISSKENRSDRLHTVDRRQLSVNTWVSCCIVKSSLTPGQKQVRGFSCVVQIPLLQWSPSGTALTRIICTADSGSAGQQWPTTGSWVYKSQQARRRKRRRRPGRLGTLTKRTWEITGPIKQRKSKWIRRQQPLLRTPLSPVALAAPPPSMIAQPQPAQRPLRCQKASTAKVSLEMVQSGLGGGGVPSTC